MVIQMQVGDLSVCTFLSSVLWIQREAPSLYSFQGFRSNWFHGFIIFYVITDLSLKRLFLTSSHSSHNLTNSPTVIKGIFSYVSKQSMKDQHQKQLLLTQAEPVLLDNAEELERWVISSDLLLLHEHYGHLNAAHGQYNRQQRMLVHQRTELNTATPEEAQQQKEKRKRETEKEIGREGDMIGRKARQRGWGGRQWDKETETEWVKVAEQAEEVWWGGWGRGTGSQSIIRGL